MTTSSPCRARGVRHRLAGAALVGGAVVLSGAIALPAQASPSTTPLTSESFAQATTGDDGWVLPAPSTNKACLTAGSGSGQLPIPGCSSTALDPAGSGVLRLTDRLNSQVGSVYNAVSLPTSQGLDIRFTSFQYDRDSSISGGYPTGADGISFILAATDPDDPAPPTTLGAYGGSLGYSAAGSTPGVSYGYLGFGLDVYGNFTSSDFGGSGCGASSAGGQNVGVRGPGNGTTGYCTVTTEALATGDLDDPSASSRPGSGVPVEVALNPSSGAVTSASGLPVPPHSLSMRVATYNSGTKTLIAPLPTIAGGLDFPAGWVDPDTGLPYQLSFGWGASTGGSNEVHEVGQLQSSTLTGELPLHHVAVSGGTHQAGEPATLQVTPSLDAAGGAESQRITVTTTLPAGLTPTAGTTANGYTCTASGQLSSCRYTPSAAVAPGAAFPVLDLPVTIAASTTAGSYPVTSKVSSTDGRPVTSSGTVVTTTARPGAPTALTAVADTSSVAVSWHAPSTGEAPARYRVTASPGSATCTTTGLSCILGGVAGTSYTVTVTPVTSAGVDGTAASTTTGAVDAPEVPAVPPADAPLTLTTTDGPITTATPGQQITVVGTGFLPYSTVTIVIYSTPITLGTVTTDASGNFSKPVTIPADLEAGQHSLLAYGVDPSGDPHSLRLNITVSAATAVAPPTTSGSGLAYTGSTFHPLPVALGAGVLLLGGVALLMVTRSRRRAPSAR